LHTHSACISTAGALTAQRNARPCKARRENNRPRGANVGNCPPHGGARSRSSLSLLNPITRVLAAVPRPIKFAFSRCLQLLLNKNPDKDLSSQDGFCLFLFFFVNTFFLLPPLGSWQVNVGNVSSAVRTSGSWARGKSALGTSVRQFERVGVLEAAIQLQLFILLLDSHSELMS